MVYYEGDFYFFGGYKEEDNIDPSLAEQILYKYTLSTLTWSLVTTSNTINNRAAFGMAVYNGSLYMFPGWSDWLKDQRTILKLNLKTTLLTWQEVRYTNDIYEPLIPYDSYGFDFKGSIGYFSCGWNVSELKNNLSLIDLDSAEPLTFVVVTTNFIAPSARMGHQLVTIGTHLLMFGGQGKNSK